MVEEGVRGLASSSFEIILSAQLLTKLNILEHREDHNQTAPQTMLKRTTNHAVAHHKARLNSPRNTIQKPKQRPEHKQKGSAHTPKNFSQTHTNPSLSINAKTF